MPVALLSVAGLAETAVAIEVVIKLKIASLMIK